MDPIFNNNNIMKFSKRRQILTIAQVTSISRRNDKAHG